MIFSSSVYYACESACLRFLAGFLGIGARFPWNEKKERRILIAHARAVVMMIEARGSFLFYFFFSVAARCNNGGLLLPASVEGLCARKIYVCLFCKEVGKVVCRCVGGRTMR